MLSNEHIKMRLDVMGIGEVTQKSPGDYFVKFISTKDQNLSIKLKCSQESVYSFPHMEFSSSENVCIL